MKPKPRFQGPWPGRLYVILLFFMGVTGFAQMPIFKRYYVADIPGLGWLADFYLTHDLHYLGAWLLIALFCYQLMGYFMAGRPRYRLTASAWVRLAILSGLLVTGVFRVLKNLPDVFFSPDFIVLIDISHLGLTFVLILTAIVCAAMRARWLKA